MADNLTIAIISAASAIIGGTIVAFSKLFSTKISLDREDRRQRKELERSAANDRINNLYKPLINIMSPSPPYDEGINLDRRDCSRIIDIIEANEKFASPELMEKYYQFVEYFYNDCQNETKHDFDYELFYHIDSEYKELKNVLGYGSILRQPPKFKIILNMAPR